MNATKWLYSTKIGMAGGTAGTAAVQSTQGHLRHPIPVHLRWTPHSVIVTIRDDKDYIGSDYIPIPLLQGGGPSNVHHYKSLFSISMSVCFFH